MPSRIMYVDYGCSISLQATTTKRESPRTDEENKELTDLALRGLQLLSAWTQQVLELVRCLACLSSVQSEAAVTSR